MENTFVKAINTSMSHTTTENGANAYTTTGDALIDLFGVLGSLRNADDERVTRLFEKAFNEDALLATKMMFYARSIRECGLGERKIFKTILKWMAVNHKQIVLNNLPLIPEFGRWDDLYELVGTPCEDAMWGFMNIQLTADIDGYNNNQPISLMAKWLKSINTSSKESRKLALKTASHFGMTPERYRKTLSKLRAYLEVVEKKMSANEWSSITYDTVPSKAMANYRNAFAKHEPERFENYVNSVKAGTAKVNSATLYPYELFEKMGFTSGYWGKDFSFTNPDDLLEEQWKALPNYVESGDNILIMADTSGSMQGRPMATSVSLATYFAERNTGAFHNIFMTFSSNPEFVKLQGNTLSEKIKCVKGIVSSTNLERAFKKILETAIQGKVPADDMPRALVVISDGEIDYFNHNSFCWSFLSVMRSEFERYGYELPNVVMWNVESRHDHYLATSEFRGVQFASGSSPSVFKSLIANMGKSAWQAMVDTLNNPIFDKVTV